MKRYIPYLMVLFMILLGACSEHELEYDCVDVQEGQSSVRIMYDLGNTASTSLNISKLELNDSQVSSVSTALGDGFPNYAGRYFTVPTGNLNIKMFRSAGGEVYNRDVSTPSGKNTFFVYDLNQDPLVFADEPFPTFHQWNDTCCYINFVNLHRQADGVTPYGKLTLKIRRDISRTPGVNTYEYIAVGTVDFGKYTGWVKFDLHRTKDGNREDTKIWDGAESGLVYYLEDENGVRVHTSATNRVLTKGRYMFFHVNGNGTPGVSSSNTRLSTWTCR